MYSNSIIHCYISHLLHLATTADVITVSVIVGAVYSIIVSLSISAGMGSFETLHRTNRT